MPKIYSSCNQFYPKRSKKNLCFFFFLEENSSTSVNMMPNRRGKEKKVVPAVKAAGRVGGSQCWLDEDRMINYS